MNQQYFDVIMQGGPIPGSSLTSDPDNPAPYERPPEYTNIHEASEWIFSKLIDEETYPEMIQVIANDMPIMDIAQVILFGGFLEGIPNAFYDIKESFVNDDKVTCRWVCTGTQSGNFYGMPPTNKDVNVNGITIFRIADGKIAELWNVWDQFTLVEQLKA